MTNQRELRTRKYPLLERVERMNQKEQAYQEKENDFMSIFNLGDAPVQEIKPIQFFTKLKLLNNKRRYR